MDGYSFKEKIGSKKIIVKNHNKKLNLILKTLQYFTRSKLIILRNVKTVQNEKIGVSLK